MVKTTNQVKVPSKSQFFMASVLHCHARLDQAADLSAAVPDDDSVHGAGTPRSNPVFQDPKMEVLRWAMGLAIYG